MLWWDCCRRAAGSLPNMLVRRKAVVSSPRIAEIAQSEKDRRAAVLMWFPSRKESYSLALGGRRSDLWSLLLVTIVVAPAATGNWQLPLCDIRLCRLRVRLIRLASTGCYYFFTSKYSSVINDLRKMVGLLTSYIYLALSFIFSRIVLFFPTDTVAHS